MLFSVFVCLNRVWLRHGAPVPWHQQDHPGDPPMLSAVEQYAGGLGNGGESNIR